MTPHCHSYAGRNLLMRAHCHSSAGRNLLMRAHCHSCEGRNLLMRAHCHSGAGRNLLMRVHCHSCEGRNLPIRPELFEGGTGLRRHDGGLETVRRVFVHTTSICAKKTALKVYKSKKMHKRSLNC
jgi:hypothetical protein